MCYLDCRVLAEAKRGGQNFADWAASFTMSSEYSGATCFAGSTPSTLDIDRDNMMSEKERA
jgi:hypothetical protein